MAFHLGKFREPGGVAATPPEKNPSFQELLEIAARSYLTVDEAKLVAWRFVRRARDWQARGNRRDPKLYRQDTREEGQ